MTDDEPYLVPGRSCGECTACCRELAIVDAALTKLPGVTCSNCVVGRGCTIYETRPKPCRSYYCLWRSIPDLADSWRPDRIGAMIIASPLPAGYSGPFAVSLVLVGAPEVLQGDDFVSIVAGFIDTGMATYLDVPGPPGMYGHHRLLNDIVGPAVAARDRGRVKALVWQLYLALAGAPTRAITDEDVHAANASNMRLSEDAPLG
jgi:hypothetical protein